MKLQNSMVFYFISLSKWSLLNFLNIWNLKVLSKCPTCDKKMSVVSSETRSCIEMHFYFLVGILGLLSTVFKPSPNLLSSLRHVILSSIWIGTLLFVTRDFGKTSCLLPHYLLIVFRWNSFSYSSSSALFSQNWMTQQLRLQDDHPNNSPPFIQWPTNEHLQQAHLVHTFSVDLWQWPKLPLPTCKASSSSR